MVDGDSFGAVWKQSLAKLLFPWELKPKHPGVVETDSLPSESAQARV